MHAPHVDSSSVSGWHIVVLDAERDLASDFLFALECGFGRDDCECGFSSAFGLECGLGCDVEHDWERDFFAFEFDAGCDFLCASLCGFDFGFSFDLKCDF